MEILQIEVKQINPEKLRQARQTAKMTQSELGRVLEVGKSMVRHFESGYARLNADQLALWAEACSVTDLDSFYSVAPRNAFRLPRKPLAKSIENSLT
jgi:transcriptional regulator with XRE-family HTH domain